MPHLESVPFLWPSALAGCFKMSVYKFVLWARVSPFVAAFAGHTCQITTYNGTILKMLLPGPSPSCMDLEPFRVQSGKLHFKQAPW